MIQCDIVTINKYLLQAGTMSLASWCNVSCKLVQCLLQAGACLLQAGACLLQAGACLLQAGACLLQAGAMSLAS
ncbi:Uncharacterized protein BM_BM17487 [Brugia malayi]|uniref:Uncharacterized protein n=1 Tax=Brugia malayi TaxID=6279 RepID=A0A4E9FAE3_BRUMA|nr:Uncharacterized protein BM_BM17487 [Brugia malayi]VIO93342.1 Uncharacterized protein BM_BM17487 [Brugia malayi]